MTNRVNSAIIAARCASQSVSRAIAAASTRSHCSASATTVLGVARAPTSKSRRARSSTRTLAACRRRNSPVSTALSKRIDASFSYLQTRFSCVFAARKCNAHCVSKFDACRARSREPIEEPKMTWRRKNRSASTLNCARSSRPLVLCGTKVSMRCESACVCRGQIVATIRRSSARLSARSTCAA